MQGNSAVHASRLLDLPLQIIKLESAIIVTRFGVHESVTHSCADFLSFSTDRDSNLMRKCSQQKQGKINFDILSVMIIV